MKRITLILLLAFTALTGSAQSVRELQARDCVIQTFQSQVGIKEETGQNDGFHVEKYLRTTDLGPGYAWCAAFVNWTHEVCGISGPEKLPAWSPSWFPKERIIHREPTSGDVFGIWFSSKGRIAHVGFIQIWTTGRYFGTVEGNTNEAGSREGDGVHRKYRLKEQAYRIASWI